MNLDESIELIGDNIDNITLDVPLFIRLLEYAREDAKDDMDLHDVAEKAISLSKKAPLTMADYNIIIDNKIEKNLKKMEELKNMPVSEMRNIMNKMMLSEEISGCLYEVLVNEGFLSQDLNEDEGYDTQCSLMMEDDDILTEMFNSCLSNEEECGENINEWMSNNLDEISWNGLKNVGKFWGNKAGNAAKSAGQAIGNKAASVGQAIGDKAVSAGQAIGNKATSMGQAIGNKAANIGRAVGNAATAAGQSVVNTASNVGKAVGNAATSAGNAVSNTVGNAIQQSKQVYNTSVQNDAVNKLQQMAVSLKNQIDVLNAATIKAGGEPLNVNSILTTIKNQLTSKSGNLNLGRYGMSEGYEQEEDLDEVNPDALQNFIDQYGEKKGKEIYYATANKQNRSPETFKKVTEIDDEDEDYDESDPAYIELQKQIKSRLIDKFRTFVYKFIPLFSKLNPSDIQMYFTLKNEFQMDDFTNYLVQQDGESNDEYFDRLTNYHVGNFDYVKILDGFVNPRKGGFFVTYGKKIDPVLLEDLGDICVLVFEQWNKINDKIAELEKLDTPRRGKYRDDDDDNELEYEPSDTDISKSDKMFFNNDDDDTSLYEQTVPIKGKGVDQENKKNASKEIETILKDAQKTQKTTEEKVENLKNQKYEMNSWEADVDEKLHGWHNNLDLDYTSNLSDKEKDRISDQAMGMAPEDHANVDHDSEGGKKLVNAAKKRSEDENIDDNDYTSKVDRTSIQHPTDYEKTQAVKPKTKAEKKLNEHVNNMKRLF